MHYQKNGPVNKSIYLHQRDVRGHNSLEHTENRLPIYYAPTYVAKDVRFLR
jgi:hypothetical protein